MWLWGLFRCISTRGPGLQNLCWFNVDNCCFCFYFCCFLIRGKTDWKQKSSNLGIWGKSKISLGALQGQWVIAGDSSLMVSEECLLSTRDSVIVCLWTSWLMLCGEYVGPRTLFSCVRRSYCFSASSLKPRGMAFTRPQRKGKHLLILSCVTPWMSQVRALGTRNKVPVQFPGNQTCRTGLTRHGSFWVKMTVSHVRQLHSWNCDCDVMESSAEHS